MTPFRSPLHGIRPVLERVRQAEELIAAGKYEIALEHLRAAQAAEPTNQYIPALVERTVAQLQSSTARRATGSGTAGQLEWDETEEGRRVQRLTLMAKDLFERGSYETAFQTLVKASQLAPTSPYVLECQKTLSPAMELLRKPGTVTGVHVPAGGSSASRDETEEANWRRRIISPPKKQREPELDPLEVRIQALRRRKELERHEREIAMWREAAKPPRILQKSPGTAPGTPGIEPTSRNT